MPKKPRMESMSPRDIVPIVGDAAIAGPIAEGMLVPLLIVDTSERPDIAEVIRVHKHIAPGDVRFQWAGPQGHPEDVLLVLDFERPIETRAILRFNIETQAILVEAALTAKALYLQTGRPGDRLMHDPDRPKILIELPDVEFRPQWDRLFLDQMTVVMSQRLKVSKRKAEPYARQVVDDLRKLTAFRMPR